MTVEQAIERLQRLSANRAGNSKLKMMLDCPHCGHSQELTALDEVVVLSAQPRAAEPQDRKDGSSGGDSVE